MADKSADKSGSDTESEHEEGRRRERPRETVPDAVDFFLGELLKALQTRNVPELHKLYEDSFNKLSDKHYAKSRWPSVDTIKETSEFASEPLFLIFYKELYYRHIYSRLPVLFQDRVNSWQNYCTLLDLIIDELQENVPKGEALSLSLPAQWLWDVLDEFVYHYQTYCHYRNKAVKKQDREIDQIKGNLDVCETKAVFNYLHQLVRYSRIEEYLANPSNPSGKVGGAFTDETVRLIGYFALMQLLRMHSLLGDYYLAMKTIERIDFSAEVPLFYLIPACHVTLYYYMGFAYLMLRRYADSIRVFNDILAFLAKAAGISTQSYQQDAMTKKQEQMYNLLLLALTLCPRPVDETIERTIRDKHAEKSARLQRGEELCFEDLFQFSSPKFVTAAPPNFEDASLNIHEALHRQVALFKAEVKQQQFLPKIAAYMKLYTTITVKKLAQLCEMDEDALRDQLMCVHHKTKQRVRRPGTDAGAPLDGSLQSCSDVEFYLDGDVVHINAQRDERPHEEVFLEHILKYQDLLKKMSQ